MKASRIVLIIVGLVVALVVAAYFLIPVIGGEQFSAQHKLEEYINAIKDGNISKAMEIDGTATMTTKDRVLGDRFLTDPEKRIRNVKVDKIDATDNARVTFTLDTASGAEDIAETVHIVREGSDYLVLPKFRITGKLLQPIRVEVEGDNYLSINGERWDKFTEERRTGQDRDEIIGHTFDMMVYPGVYTTKVDSQVTFFKNPELEMRYVENSKFDETAGESYRNIKIEPTDELQNNVKSQTASMLSGCAASSSPTPQNKCPIYVTQVLGGTSYQGVSYSIAKQPEVEVHYDKNHFVFQTKTGGSYTQKYQYRSDTAKGDRWLNANKTVTDLRPEGFVSFDDNHQLVVEFGAVNDYWNKHATDIKPSESPSEVVSGGVSGS